MWTAFGVTIGVVLCCLRVIPFAYGFVTEFLKMRRQGRKPKLSTSQTAAPTTTSRTPKIRIHLPNMSPADQETARPIHFSVLVSFP
jgi:hypothetical protein